MICITAPHGQRADVPAIDALTRWVFPQLAQRTTSGDAVADCAAPACDCADAAFLAGIAMIAPHLHLARWPAISSPTR
jgi:hypothetical protein